MNEGKLFSELELNNKPLRSMEATLHPSPHYKLYVDIEDNSFYAVAIRFNSCVNDGDIWECPELRVDNIFEVTAYFDGVRHLEFNRHEKDLEGYIYYPDIQAIIDMLNEVRKIELQVCRMCIGGIDE